jgi:hypothetical protein
MRPIIIDEIQEAAMQTKKESEIRKNRKILEKIITVFHPQYLNKKVDKLMSYNVPSLLEKTGAIVGGNEVVDAAHFDLSDGTEFKSGTVGANPSKENGTSHPTKISNTISVKGIVKAGDLRVVIYNNVTDDLEYFFIPQCDIKPLSYFKDGKLGEINCSFNSKTLQFTKIEKYRMPDFVSLCKRQPTRSLTEILKEQEYVERESSAARKETIESEFRKNQLILKQIITIYNPEYYDLDISDPKDYDVSKMLEETMALVGGYTFLDGSHFDFSDGTECKTGSVQRNPRKQNGIRTNNHDVRISSTSSGAGVSKTGDLRVVIYNNVTNKLEFFFIPQRDIDKLTSMDGYKKKGDIKTTYNRETNKITALEKYRMSDFVSLCKRQPSSLDVVVSLEPWMNISNNMENANVCVN